MTGRFVRRACGVLAIWAVAAGCAVPAAATPRLSDILARIDAVNGAPVVPAACCRTCRKGKACGDSCISKSKTCRTPPGCACDG